MSSERVPRHDPPLAPDLIRYCAARLSSLGLPIDREWLRGQPTIVELLCGGDQRARALEARQNIPKSTASWETSEFYRWAIPLAIFDLLNGPFIRFDQFEFLYLKLLGEDARPWLPSLFLAAADSPTLSEHHRFCLLRMLDARRLSDLKD